MWMVSKRVAVTIALTIVIAIVCTFSLVMPLNSSLKTPVVFRLEKGVALKQTLSQLQSDNTLPSIWPVRLLVKIMRVDKQLQAGEYQINAGTTAMSLVSDISHGQVKQYKLTIVDGWTVRQLNSYLASQSKLSHRHVDKRLLANVLGTHVESLEGLLLPDTYYYTADDNNTDDILDRAHYRLLDFLAKAWKQRGKNIAIKTPYQALIIASMIEKESASAHERPLISAVIHNRLRLRMMLQIDPTVIYALGNKYTGKLHKHDLKIKSPFNTYRHYGLPPTPIAFVSKSSIMAALHPTDVDYLYFVAGRNGHHVFAASLSVHNRNVHRKM